ncbi:MAG: alcohol dehydrogenase catalytic domain-containing protein [SAR324 cluster bacterium]|nr:alcohol dehydrogenase catalytic domain-containing protein [SAR324 cluster bacterium]
MMAAVLMGPNQVELQEVETPSPGPADVLIRVETCAVCSTDVSLIAKPFAGQPPYGDFIIGHEYAGVVVALGETVDEFKLGDRVAVEAHLGCSRCRNCRRGNYTSCLNHGNRKKGHRANGFTTNGGDAQYVINHINTVYKIPDTLSFEEAALVTNLGCVLYGFETMGGFVVGDNVAVIGPGPLGLISIQAAKALGAGRTFLVGRRDAPLQIGKANGADRVININKEDAAEVIREETDGVGADIVFESSGNQSGLDLAVKVAKRMGQILLLGFAHEPIPADFAELALNNKSIHTVRGESWANVGRAVSLLKQQKVNLRPLVTHSFPLSQIDEAYKTYTERKDGAIKVVVKPNES